MGLLQTARQTANYSINATSKEQTNACYIYIEIQLKRRMIQHMVIKMSLHTQKSTKWQVFPANSYQPNYLAILIKIYFL